MRILWPRRHAKTKKLMFTPIEIQKSKTGSLHPAKAGLSLTGFTLRTLREETKKYGFRIKKRLGQNFLIDQNILLKLTNSMDLEKKDVILEIGSGFGNMTELIAPRVKYIIGVEIDELLCRISTNRLSMFDNAKILHRDILDVDIKDLYTTTRFKVVGNLPYYITTPIIFHLLDQRMSITKIFLTVQKEVADRLAAKPGTKDYGVLSIGVQYFTHVKRKFIISKNVFYPIPKVHSAFVMLEILDKPRVHVKDEKLFFEIVKASFNQRRKTVLNSLAHRFITYSKDSLLGILKKAGIGYNVRGEDLAIEDFAAIANLF